MARKQLLMIQPGAFGDIFDCAPIAKHYWDIGYDITWPTREQFAHLFEYFEYVNHDIVPDVQIHSDWLQSDVDKILRLYDLAGYDKVLNLADRGPHPTAQRHGESSPGAKYRMAELSFSLKYNLEWKRNIQREKELYDKVVGDLKDYVFCHTISSRDHTAVLPPSIARLQ
jgi:hypothetical protein